MEKINETKSWFTEMIKLIKFQPDTSRKKKRKVPNKMRNDKREVTTDT